MKLLSYSSNIGIFKIAFCYSGIAGYWVKELLRLVPSWDQEGTKLVALDWPKIKVSSKEEIQKVPGWDQEGTKLLHKKIKYFIQILTLASKPISLEELMKNIGYKNRTTFRGNYLEHFENVGFISKTNPEALTSPDQKYVSTEKGRLFLSGHKLSAE